MKNSSILKVAFSLPTDEPDLSFMELLLGSMGVDLGSKGLNKLYHKAVMEDLFKKPITFNDLLFGNASRYKLLQEAKRLGAKDVTIHTPIQASNNYLNSLKPTKDPIENLFRKLKAKALASTPAFFDPSTKNVGIANNADNAILAHELGHALQGRILGGTPIRALGAMGAGAGSLIPWVSEEYGDEAAILGTAAGLPTIVSELDASNKGRKILKNLNMKGGLKAFAGVPTYVLAALAPLLNLGVSDYLREN